MLSYGESLQLTIDEVGHQLVKVEAGVAPIDAVVLIGIDSEFELLTSIFKGSNHVDRILEMDIVVARSVDQQIVTFQEVGKVER